MTLPGVSRLLPKEDTMPRLTKSLLDGLGLPSREMFVWDSVLRGFGVRLRPGTLTKTFYVQYRLPGGVQRRRKLGLCGVLTVEEARSHAREWLAAVALGRDPHAPACPHALPTVADLAERFWSEHVLIRMKPKSRRHTASILRLYILPALDTALVQDVSTHRLRDLHARLHDRPYQANRVKAVLSKMFALAEYWGWRELGTNPARGIQAYREYARERYLTPDEVQRLWEALDHAQAARTYHYRFPTAIRLLLLTGARVGEILGLQWRWIDWQQGQARLPDSKTGPKTLYFSDEALAVLRHLSRAIDNPYVLPGIKTGQPYVGLRLTWEHFRLTIDLDDVRLHDLRHTYAAYAAGAGATLPQIGALLGHKHPQATARYAHIAPQVAHAAAAQTGAALARVLRGED
jgi:integrase